MRKKATINVYLAGGMEHEVGMGESWRDVVAGNLKKYTQIKVWNPCEFEKEQLEGLRPGRLPDIIKKSDGTEVKVTHWHQLKYASRGSYFYSRFKRYMRLIIQYDLRLVAQDMDYVICYWTDGAAKGAGTHSELSTAFMHHKPVYTVVKPGVELPGWLEGASTRVYDCWEDLYTALEEEFGYGIAE